MTVEDPRSESVNVINRQIKDGVKTNHGNVLEIPDRKMAIQFACKKLARQHDVVLILGKGHEKSMNLDGKTETPWSDQSVVLDCMKTM